MLNPEPSDMVIKVQVEDMLAERSLRLLLLFQTSDTNCACVLTVHPRALAAPGQRDSDSLSKMRRNFLRKLWLIQKYKMQLRNPLVVGSQTTTNSIHSGTPSPEIAVEETWLG